MIQIVKNLGLAVLLGGLVIVSQSVVPDAVLQAAAQPSGQTGQAQEGMTPAQMPPEMAEFADIEISPVEQLLMRKLDLTSDLLEAIIIRDPESLQEYTQELIELTESEEWGQISDATDYQQRSLQFQKAARALKVMNIDKNPRAVTKTYYNLLEQCMGCHMVGGDKRAE